VLAFDSDILQADKADLSSWTSTFAMTIIFTGMNTATGALCIFYYGDFGRPLPLLIFGNSGLKYSSKLQQINPKPR
jgi:hypothetical protein